MTHILGVDHAAHAFDLDGSIHITRKLKDTDSLVKKILDKVDEDTIVIMFGDHGMTPGGSHGSNSDLETHTVMFMYSKSGLPSQGSSQIPSISMKNLSKQISSEYQKLWSDIGGIFPINPPEGLHKDKAEWNSRRTTTKQNDIAATLSVLLGG
jgi:predicted AlkP superfamily pyrophosphatase or phosphodiesterase